MLTMYNRDLRKPFNTEKKAFFKSLRKSFVVKQPLKFERPTPSRPVAVDLLDPIEAVCDVQVVIDEIKEMTDEDFLAMQPPIEDIEEVSDFELEPPLAKHTKKRKRTMLKSAQPSDCNTNNEKTTKNRCSI